MFLIWSHLLKGFSNVFGVVLMWGVSPPEFSVLLAAKLLTGSSKVKEVQLQNGVVFLYHHTKCSEAWTLCAFCWGIKKFCFFVCLSRF